MSNARMIILRLLKRLGQVFAALSTSAAQRLHILVSCFRHFVTKIRGQPGHDTSSDSESRSFAAQCDTVLTSTGTSSARCPDVTSLLPFHNRRTASSTPDTDVATALSSTPHPNIPVASVPPQATLPRTPFAPLIASDVPRYDDRPLASVSPPHERLPILMRSFPNQSYPWLTGDWKSYVHPEGALYLYNNTVGQRAYTEAIIDEAKFRTVAGYVNALFDLARMKSVDLAADDIELVVQLEEGQAGVSCQYYFVDHNARTLFWLHDPHEATVRLFGAVQVVYGLSHMIEYALEQEYCRPTSFETNRMHCERYPNHKLDRVKVIKELRELVIHASAEIITSNMSLSPFDADELSRILGLIDHLKENAEDENSPHSIFAIARFIHYFARAKFFNFCGLPCARLDADKSIYPEETDFNPLTSSFYFAFEVMLFWAPRARLNDLQKVWVDESVITPRWKNFNKNLMTEWTGITIYSTVMLAVDISFLAVPNVNIGQSQSIGVIATYLSIIFITGSLIVSLLLARQNQKYGFESADKATEFLENITKTLLGMKGLATIHSLPYAMLMWG
ncbi:hypothetical protein M405DRAFT_855331 [Rhizopogon salebrosus TDB-379]|nr:hypothetical protein M405DRAFT_855331 [Rhizopogon salebrosus TDB-379]